MQYEVTINFRKKVSEKDLPEVIKKLSATKIDGFEAGEISTHKSYENDTVGQSPMPVRIVKKKKSKKVRSTEVTK